MVIYFCDLKKIVHDQVVDQFDHSLMVSGQAPAEMIESYRKHFSNVIVSPFQPTCENLVSDVASRLAGMVPPGIFLHSVRLYETATAYAEWYASDN